MPVFRCPYCNDQEFVAPSKALLMIHVRIVHSLDPDFSIQCSKDNCSRTFTNFRTFQNHLLTHNLDEPPLISPEEHQIEPDYSIETELVALPCEEEIKSYCAKWILKTSETRSLTRRATLGIVEDNSSLVTFITQLLWKRASAILVSSEVDTSVISRFDELFSSSLTKPFNGLTSFHQQLCYYRDNFNLIEPKRIVLSQTATLRLVGRKRKLVENKTEVIYIPLLDTLQSLLNNNAILQEVENSHILPPPLLGDYCDGQHFKNHSLFSTNATALQIVLYYDELELCNPLGSRRKKHKIGAFYYMLGNIRPQFRSRINTIQLIQLVKYTTVADFGIDRIIEPFVKDLRKLESVGLRVPTPLTERANQASCELLALLQEFASMAHSACLMHRQPWLSQDEGVTFVINGEERNFHGAVTVVSADNPASALLSGFKQSASAFRFCRHCMGTESANIQSKFVEANFRLRCASDHLRHCELIEQPSILEADRQHFSTTYGVNRRALLDTLSYVDVTSGSFIPDVMHDVLEGVLPLEMKLMLKVLVIEEKLFTLEMVDDSIRRLNLRLCDGDKPSPLTGISLTARDSNLRQHAMQMWTLARFLPLAIGHLIPVGHSHWENFLCLLDIMDIIFARCIPQDQCGYLESLVSDHHSCFKELYPDASITMKMHAMIHMPRLILEFGPLINHWTTRFEAKHKYFKHLANLLGNFTNICYSLALRHQLHQCYLSLNGSTLPNEVVQIGPGTTVQCPTLSFWNSSDILSVSSLFRANWVNVSGTDYRTPFALVVGRDDNENLKFGDIRSIYVNGLTVLFEFLPMVTLEFHVHTHSYIISSPPVTERCTFLIKHNDLHDYHPFGMYSLSPTQHIIVRSNVYTI